MIFDKSTPFKTQTSAIYEIASGAKLLKGFALDYEEKLILDTSMLMRQSKPRHMMTPRGFKMSVAMTSCGNLGWTSSNRGYVYHSYDPETSLPWPKMPDSFVTLARESAGICGFPDFIPDSCLINLYSIGAKMALHQDKDEKDMESPIVSVSLGIPAIFMFGGNSRKDKVRRILLEHGDIVVWGGSSRLNFHGIMPIQENSHGILGRSRINLTFRKVER